MCNISYSTEKPNVIQPLGDGNSYYNYDIEQVEVSNGVEAAPLQQWRCKYVKIQGEITSNKVILALIRECLSENAELKLINRYQSHQLGIIEDADAERDYKEFLRKRAAIKEMVERDIKD